MLIFGLSGQNFSIIWSKFVKILDFCLSGQHFSVFWSNNCQSFSFSGVKICQNFDFFTSIFFFDIFVDLHDYFHPLGIYPSPL